MFYGIVGGVGAALGVCLIPIIICVHRRKKEKKEDKQKQRVSIVAIPAIDTLEMGIVPESDWDGIVVRTLSVDETVEPDRRVYRFANDKFDRSAMESWIEHFSKEYNRAYWYNPVSKESVWVDPTKVNPNAKADTLWVEHYSKEHNAPYWHNAGTGESVWIKPH